MSSLAARFARTGREANDKEASPAGYVAKGAITSNFADHAETYSAGDAFYVPAGHGPANAEETEHVQFSPTEELAVVSETIERNVAAMLTHPPSWSP